MPYVGWPQGGVLDSGDDGGDGAHAAHAPFEGAEVVVGEGGVDGEFEERTPGGDEGAHGSVPAG